jgi:crossover junction endodeoxyribonuclease RuvC
LTHKIKPKKSFNFDSCKIRKILKTERIILGIDPGTVVMGFGVIKVIGNKMELILMDELILSKYDSHSLRLKKIFERTLQLVDEYHPDELAIEAPFFGKNVQSMLKLGRAQGVAMAAGLYREVPITEYLPKKVKMAITGNGNASKEQVAGMLQRLLNISVLPTKLDATDGLAVAVCHFYNGGKTSGKKKYGSWQSFISDNPKRVKK